MIPPIPPLVRANIIISWIFFLKTFLTRPNNFSDFFLFSTWWRILFFSSRFLDTEDPLIAQWSWHSFLSQLIFCKKVSFIQLFTMISHSMLITVCYRHELFNKSAIYKIRKIFDSTRNRRSERSSMEWRDRLIPLMNYHEWTVVRILYEWETQRNSRGENIKCVDSNILREKMCSTCAVQIS